MKKRILSMLCAVCLVIGLLPVTALAASPTSTDFVLNFSRTTAGLSTSNPVLETWQGDASTISKGQTKYFLSVPYENGTTTQYYLSATNASSENYNVKFEYPENGTPMLTLNNVNINAECGIIFGTNTYGTPSVANTICEVPLIIVLKGTNTIKTSASGMGALDLFTKGDVTIRGEEGSVLNISNNKSGTLGAINTYGNLTFDNANITITTPSGNNGSGNAISALGADIVIKGGSMHIDGRNSSYEGIRSFFYTTTKTVGNETVGGNVTIQDGASVSGVTDVYHADTMRIAGDFTIRNSDVEFGIRNQHSSKSSFVLFQKAPVLDFPGGYTALSSTSKCTYSDGAIVAPSAKDDYTNETTLSTVKWFKVTHTCVAGEPVPQPVADCSTKANAIIYCTICDKKLDETTTTLTPTADHTPGTPTEVRVEATTTADGYYYYVTECTECKEEISRTEEVVIKKNPDVFYFNFKTNYPAIGSAKAIAIGTTAYYKTYTETLGNGNETVGLTTGNADTWNLKIEYPITGPATITLKDLNMKTAGVGLIFGQNTYRQLSTTTCDVPMNVVLDGTNVIDTTVYYTNAHVLGGLSFYTTGDVTISGDGSLSLIDNKGINNDCSTAGTIYALGNLYFDNVDVSVTLKETSNKAHAISTVGGDIVIDGGHVVVNAIDDPSTKGTDDKKTDLQGEAVRSVFYATNNGTKGGNLTIKNNAYVTAYASPYANSGDDEFYYIVDIDGAFTVVDSVVELAITGQWFGTRVFKPGVVPVMTFTNGSDAKGGSYYGSTSAIVPANTAAYDAELVNDYSYFKAAAKPYKFLGTQLELKDALDIRFGISKAVTSMDGYVMFSLNGGEAVRKEMSEVVEDLPSYYAVVYPGMAAKQMRDEVSVTIYDKYGNQVSETLTNSIYNYAVGRLQKSNDAAFKTLLMDMLNYGAMAQTQFSYNTGKLANEGLDAYKQYATVTMKDCVDYSTKEGEGHLGTQLQLENNIFMRMGFSTETIGPNAYAVITYTDYLGEETTTTVQGSVPVGASYTAFNFDKMVAADCRCVSVWKFYKEDGTLVATVEDSIESYVSRRVGVNAYLKEMMMYCDSALNYFSNK